MPKLTRQPIAVTKAKARAAQQVYAAQKKLEREPLQRQEAERRAHRVGVRDVGRDPRNWRGFYEARGCSDIPPPRWGEAGSREISQVLLGEGVPEPFLDMVSPDPDDYAEAVIEWNMQALRLHEEQAHLKAGSNCRCHSILPVLFPSRIETSTSMPPSTLCSPTESSPPSSESDARSTKVEALRALLKKSVA